MPRRARRSLTVLSLAAAALALAPAARADGDPPLAGRGQPRVVRLKIADVGRLALKNSPDYRAQQLDPAIARTREREALGEFDPLLGARASVADTHSPSFFNPVGGASSSSRQSVLEEFALGGSLDASQTTEWGGTWRLGWDATSTDRGGAAGISTLSPRYDGVLSLGYTHPLLRNAGRDVRLSNAREAARIAEDSQQQLTRTAELTVADAEALYWDLVGAIADREVVRKSVEVARELLSVAEARLAAKTGIPVEVAEARSGVARREVDLIARENDVQNLSDRLRALVFPFEGDAPDLELRIEPDDTPTRNPTALPGMPGLPELEAALERRTDVIAAQKRIEAAELAELRARNGTEPELNAFGSGGLRGVGSGFSESADRIEDRDTFAWELGLEFRMPFGNIAEDARHRRAGLELDRSMRRMSALRNAVVRELREASRNIRSAAERIAAAGRARSAAEEQLAAERARLRNGRSTPFRVLEVEEDLSTAEAAEIQARVDYEKSRVALEAAGGTLLTSRDLVPLVGGE